MSNIDEIASAQIIRGVYKVPPFSWTRISLELFPLFVWCSPSTAATDLMRASLPSSSVYLEREGGSRILWWQSILPSRLSEERESLHVRLRTGYHHAREQEQSPSLAKLIHIGSIM